MKIALCLSGQPRGLRAFEYVERNLLSQYDVDVFCHMWTHPNPKLATQHFSFIINNYHPRAIVADQEWDSTVGHKYTRVTMPEWYPAHFTLAYHYSLYTANQLKKVAEEENGRKYDVVIRSRYDYAINFIIPVNDVVEGKVYVPSDRMNEAHDFCNPEFAYGTSTVMDKYSATHLYIDEYYNGGASIIGEDLLQANLRKHNLIGENLVYVDVNNPFPPGAYNGNPHSIVRDDIMDWKAKELFFLDNTRHNRI